MKSQKSTLGIDMFAVKVPLADITVELVIWDTAGQEKYFSLTKSKTKMTLRLLPLSQLWSGCVRLEQL